MMTLKTYRKLIGFMTQVRRTLRKELLNFCQSRASIAKCERSSLILASSPCQ